MPTILLWPRRAGKSWMLEQLKGADTDAITVSGDIVELKTGVLGAFGGLRIIHDMKRAAIDNAAQPDQYRIQHGPVRKDRGGKVRKW